MFKNAQRRHKKGFGITAINETSHKSMNAINASHKSMNAINETISILIYLKVNNILKKG